MFYVKESFETTRTEFLGHRLIDLFFDDPREIKFNNTASDPGVYCIRPH